MPHTPDLNTTYICVDLEASGPVPGLYNMVSIGGVEVTYNGERHERGREFYFELKPILMVLMTMPCRFTGSVELIWKARPTR